MHSILVAEDHQDTRESLHTILDKEGYRVITAKSGDEAVQMMGREAVDLILTDLKMPGIDGMQLLKMADQLKPKPEVVMMTAHGTIETAVEAIKQGAYDFITKPFKRADLLKTLNKAKQHRQLLNENKQLRSQLKKLQKHKQLLGNSPLMQKVRERIQQVAPSTATVLIQGASGTGKELAAQSIHVASGRSDKAFVAVNCSAIPETLLESELFGYEKGAFTGANARKAGRFERANQGSIFLDEIASLPLQLQGKLLRILQEGECEMLGATRPVHVDVRVIAASNVDLKNEVEAGRFRDDLYYRLNVIPVELPPLKDRKEDIPLLVQHFIQQYATLNHKDIDEINAEDMKKLSNYTWPGNVRELENVIERSIVLSNDKQLRIDGLDNNSQKFLNFPVGTPIKEMEQAAIEAALELTGGNKVHAAKLLGITVRTIYRKV